MEMCPSYNVHCHRQSDGCSVISSPQQTPQILKLCYWTAFCVCLECFAPPKVTGFLRWNMTPPSFYATL